MKTWWSGCIGPYVLDLGRFTHGERAAGIHWIGGWVGPRTGLGEVEIILGPTGTRTPIPRSSSSFVPSRYTDRTFHKIYYFKQVLDTVYVRILVFCRCIRENGIMVSQSLCA
jgi:hypothetical protein